MRMTGEESLKIGVFRKIAGKMPARSAAQSGFFGLRGCLRYGPSGSAETVDIAALS
ncbi:MAG TPA: hypothetical protein VJ529_02260 [Candidatus Bathyarchaeia archaeon]|nr:hypothetical protein [Candidatus Bathyarchaeia archaeon]